MTSYNRVLTTVLTKAYSCYSSKAAWVLTMDQSVNRSIFVNDVLCGWILR